MLARRLLRAAVGRAAVVGVAAALAPVAGSSAPVAAALPHGSVESAAGSVGTAATPVEAARGSVGPHGGSAAALDAGSGVVTAGADGSVGSTGSAGAPIPPCPGPAPRVPTFGDAPVPVVGWTENLAFDADGRLWGSNTFLDRVDAYDAEGRVVASVPVRAPGGIAAGPDGRMHVAAGTGYLADRSDVVTFDPAAERPEARIEARLDGRKNGLAVDAAGNRYLTSLDSPRLTRVTAAGEVDDEWSRRAEIGVSNGIAIEGDTAYITQSTTRTVVLEMPLDRPESTTTTELTTPPEIARGLDDLAVTPEFLYVTSWTTGEVFRVGRGTGEGCVLVSGIPRATAVVVADGFGDLTGRDLLVTSLHGPIRHVRIPGG